MAKVTLTLEDTEDSITVSMDMGAAPRNVHGLPLPTLAVRMSRQLFDLATEAAALDNFPRHRVQPTNTTIH